MPKPFDGLLDEITEIRRNVAPSNDTRLEPRVARLEHIVQMLLALVEKNTGKAIARASPFCAVRWRRSGLTHLGYVRSAFVVLIK